MPLPRSISTFSAGLALLALFILALMFVTAFPRPHDLDKEASDRFVVETMERWQRKYATEQGLKVARVLVHFRAAPKDFVKDEGAVITPVGADLPLGQDILETAAWPPVARKLSVDGITSLAWAYPGLSRTDMNFTALCLVRQTRKGQPVFPAKSTYSRLPESFVSDALVSAKEIEEHSLQDCAAFKDWSRNLGARGSHMQQFKIVMEKIASGIVEKSKKNKGDHDDVCTAMRKFQYSPHIAHVLSVMACRELKIPCYGFIAADGNQNGIVGTYSDQSGWIYFDMAKPKKGFFSSPPVLLTRVPLISEFSACNDGFWDATASGYKTGGWGGTTSFTFTEWGEKNRHTDYTLAETFVLDKWKP